MTTFERFWQHARDIVHESAAGDVGKRLDDIGAPSIARRIRAEQCSALRIELLDELLHQRAVADVFFQQFLANRAFQSGHVARWLQFQLLEENFPRQRIAVGVQTRRCDADDGIAALDGFLAVEHPGFFHHADDGAAHVVFALLVKARHLRRLATDERAVVFRTGAGKTLDDFGEHVRLQLAGAEVIEEKQRLRAEHGDVVHAMVHEVRADSVVLVLLEGDLELGADAVHRRDEDRLAIFFHVQREQAAEAADLAEHLAAMRAGEQLRQRGFDFVAEINVNAGGGVGFLFHARKVKRQTAKRARKFRAAF